MIEPTTQDQQPPPRNSRVYCQICGTPMIGAEHYTVHGEKCTRWVCPRPPCPGMRTLPVGYRDPAPPQIIQEASHRV